MEKDNPIKTNENQSVSAAQQKLWITQLRTVFGGLIVAGLYMIQPFLSSGKPQGLAAKICVVSFAIAIPLLATLFAVVYEENPADFRKRIGKSPIMSSIKTIAQLTALTGLIAGFWHIDILAGIGMLAAIIAGLVGYNQYQRSSYK